MRNERLHILIRAFAIVATTLSFSSSANAVPLSKEALYYRCYQQLTGERPADNDPNLATFRAGSGDPIGVCITMLRSAQFTDGTQLPATPSRQVLKILTQMHRVHYSFFDKKIFDVPIRSFRDNTATGDMIDMSTPALYYTKALFDPAANATSIVTGSSYLKPKRTIMNPVAGPISNAGGKQTTDTTTGVTTTDDLTKMFPFGLASGFFTPIGDLLGVQVVAPKTYSYSWDRTRTDGTVIETINESFQIGDSLGGGFLGAESYLLLNVNQASDFQADVKVMHRRWSGAVFKDALCRGFPVIRPEDTAGFIVPTSSLPFRQQESCTQCHASMDRTASLIRGFKYYLPGGGSMRPTQFKITPVTQPAPNPAWPSEPSLYTTTLPKTSIYSQTPAHGTLYFRTASSGALVSVDVTSVEQLGQTIANQDDFYLCVANRYWNYFTNKGVKIADAQMMAGYPAAEQARLTTVKSLASNLKSNQKLITLIEAILRSPAYQDSAFGQ